MTEQGITWTLTSEEFAAARHPRYNGWEFLAAVDSIEAEPGHDFVLRADGADETGVDRSTLAAGRCEHCHTLRANRRYTYLVSNECNQPAKRLLKWAAILAMTVPNESAQYARRLAPDRSTEV